jgi:nucleoside-diphosphate-sugar epimerase
MDFLITGSSSVLGTQLIQNLNHNHNCFFICRRKTSSNNEIQINLSKKVSFSLLEKKLVFLKSIKIKSVIHLSSDVITVNNPDSLDILINNNNISHNISKIIKYLNIDQVINISSISVYQHINNTNTSSKDFFYSLSKLNGEKILNHELLNTNTKIINLRVSNILSPYYETRGILNALYYQLINTNDLTVYSNPSRKIQYVTLNYLIRKILHYTTSNKSKTIDIVEKNVFLKDYINYIVKKYGNKNTKVNYIKN